MTIDDDICECGHARSEHVEGECRGWYENDMGGTEACGCRSFKLDAPSPGKPDKISENEGGDA